MAMDPENVEKITGVDLPEIIPGKLYDNLGRSSSLCDNFYHESYFVDSLTVENIEELGSSHYNNTDSEAHQESFKEYSYKIV